MEQNKTKKTKFSVKMESEKANRSVTSCPVEYAHEEMVGSHCYVSIQESSQIDTACMSSSKPVELSGSGRIFDVSKGTSGSRSSFREG